MAVPKPLRNQLLVEKIKRPPEELPSYGPVTDENHAYTPPVVKLIMVDSASGHFQAVVEDVAQVEDETDARVKITSDHGRLRMRKRAGLPGRAVDRQALLVLERGHSPVAYSGAMRRYLDFIYHSQATRPLILVHGGQVYLYNRRSMMLITCWVTPQRYRNHRPDPKLDAASRADRLKFLAEYQEAQAAYASAVRAADEAGE